MAIVKAKRRLKKRERRSATRGPSRTSKPAKPLVVEARAKWPGGYIKMDIPYDGETGEFLYQNVDIQSPTFSDPKALGAYEKGGRVLFRVLGELGDMLVKLGSPADRSRIPTAADVVELVKRYSKKTSK